MIYRSTRPELHQEVDALPRKRVLVTTGTTVVLVCLLAYAAGRITDSREATLRPSGEFPERSIEPRRSPHGLPDVLFGRRGIGQVMNQVSAEELNRYRWIDKDRGLVSIPIDRAMEIVVEEERGR